MHYRLRPVCTENLRLSRSTCNLAALKAASADVLLDCLAVLKNGNALDIGLEGAVHNTVRVADSMTGYRMLSTVIADLRHEKTSVGRRGRCPHNFYSFETIAQDKPPARKIS